MDGNKQSKSDNETDRSRRSERDRSGKCRTGERIGTDYKAFFQYSISLSLVIFFLVLLNTLEPSFAQNVNSDSQLVWNLVKRVEDSLPFDKEKIENLFGVSLKAVQGTEEGSFQQGYLGAGGRVSGLDVAQISLTIDKTAVESPAKIFLQVPPQCTSVQEHYGRGPDEIVIPSPDAKAIFSLPYKMTWGRIVFGVKVVDDTPCVVEIGFIPTAYDEAIRRRFER